MATEVKEQKKLVFKRVPPGDRWTYVDGILSPGVQIPTYPTLTDALDGWYQLSGDTQFYMDARKGTVEIIKQEEIEIPQKRFSLYGED